MGYNFKKFLIIFFFLIFLPLLIEAIEFKPPWQTKSFQELLDAIYNFIFWVAIALVPIMVILAAYFFLTSGGDPEKVRTAKRIIFWVFIGLIIVLMGKGILPIIRQLIEGGPVAGPPPSSEVCNNNLDDDGDGLIDCFDPDCAINPVACPCPPQTCQDLLVLVTSSYGAWCGETKYNPVADINKDKKMDMRDIGIVFGRLCGDAVACQNAWNNTCDPCLGPCGEVCNNNLDDDGDGLIDCDDPDCNSDPACPCPPQVCQNLLNLTQSLFGKTCSSSDYNPVADIDKDKSIGMRDIGLVTTMCNNALACQNAWNNTCNPCIGPCP
jgi:hypothetical protein